MVGGVVLAVLVVVIAGFFISRSLDTTKDVSRPRGRQRVRADHRAGRRAQRAWSSTRTSSAPSAVSSSARPATTSPSWRRTARSRSSTARSTCSSQIGDYSARAAGAFAIVLDKSGPEVAKKFHDLLYENQPREAGPFPTTTSWSTLAVEAGADEADVGRRDRATRTARTGSTKADHGGRQTPASAAPRRSCSTARSSPDCTHHGRAGRATSIAAAVS